MFIFKRRALTIAIADHSHDKTRMAPVTNTIVFTSQDDPVLECLETLRQWLTDNVLCKTTVTAENPIQLIVQRIYPRALVVCPTHQIAQQVYETLNKAPLAKSLAFDYADADYSDSMDRLQVPKRDRVFLTSPPTSPPPGFDYARCEQPPPSHSHPQDLADDQREFLTLLDSKIASIALQRCPKATIKATNGTPARTACPPRPDDIADDF